jgi:hypothetical protein
MLCKEPIVANW